MLEQIHFTTQNGKLAFALAAVGFKLLAVWNRYTDGKLESLGCATVEQAKAQNKPGHLTYVFEREPDLDAAIEAWNAAGKALDEGSLPLNIQRTESIQIARAVMRMDEPFRQLWKQVPAMYVQTEGEPKEETRVLETTATGDWVQRVVTYPGFRVVSDNISEADRNRIFPQS